MANETLFDFVIAELTSRKDSLHEICAAMSPKKPESYRSWLTKVMDQKRIKNPSVHKIQDLADWLRRNPR